MALASTLQMHQTKSQSVLVSPPVGVAAASALRKLERNEEATAFFKRAADADPLDAHVQYKLGQHLRSIGARPRAATAFRRALELDASHTLASFWLSATRTSEDPDEPGAEESAAGGGLGDGDGLLLPPSAAPREYVVALYNSYAETFDSHLLGALAYQTPSIMVDTLASLFPGRRWRRCLDLGCGTGLSGQAVASLCHRLVGVDLSAAMLKQARRKGVYHRLLEGDVTDCLVQLAGEHEADVDWGTPMNESQRGTDSPIDVQADGGASWTTSFGNHRDEGLGSGRECDGNYAPAPGWKGDLVMSCDVFGYVGDLSACFAAVRRLFLGHEDEAIFSFSAEAPLHPKSTGRRPGGEDIPREVYREEIEEGERGYKLQSTGRFTHSTGYLQRACREAGFRVLEAKQVVLRKNAGNPVGGLVMITEPIYDRAI